ncbi:TPA: hypothetical protein ACIO89_004622 [Salmonella enterica subsp. enterica serovar Java]
MDIYVGLLVTGVVLALLSLIAGDWLESIFCPDALHPMVVASACTVTGGAGILLLKHTALTTFTVLVMALVGALVLSVAVFYGYVRPMRHSETSTAFSMRELAGKVVAPIASIDKLTVVDSGNGSGALQLSQYVTQLMATAPEMLKNVSGIDVTQLVRGLTEKQDGAPAKPENAREKDEKEA